MKRLVILCPDDDDGETDGSDTNEPQIQPFLAPDAFGDLYITNPLLHDRARKRASCSLKRKRKTP